MPIKELRKMISESLEDFKLDQNEKYEFKELSQTLDDEHLRFIKNTAFDLSRPHIEKGGSEAVRVLNWLERMLKAIQPINKTLSLKSAAYFSPGEACRDKIISLINHAGKKIDICVFTISDNTISQAILKAHQRGIKVTIISDNDKANDKGSDVSDLSASGVKVIFDHSPHHMHHKFAIFDEQQLLNGSFNWTRSATTRNEENIIVTSEPELVNAFQQKFAELKEKFGR